MTRVIEEMFAYVVEDDEGNEGVPAIKGPDGSWMPLVGADRERLESLTPYAQVFADRTGKEVKVLRFTKRKVLAVLKPNPVKNEETD